MILDAYLLYIFFKNPTQRARRRSAMWAWNRARQALAAHVGAGDWTAGASTAATALTARARGCRPAAAPALTRLRSHAQLS